ncbi:BatA domain-containing protein [Candidatus Palauibacter soopunensis]|uniref:BatA domain-containing protein n=1 Tax=Candidatus Palauibacter soopunensis TaxID=3056739 RepID=UPI002384FFB2|nr:BatA domain-containing protein [Candidatus Palauibacter soopunensis]MDE2878054.1 BatA domain-containing protein [Candidatus Palauibacter soopunensis]
MSFLYLSALALGLSVVVPLILHLRRRQTDRRVSFPALRYLSRAEDARSRSLAASDLLLLAVRIGLLIALALAAAGPLIGRGGAHDHEPTDLALIVDNSASVGRLDEDRLLFESLVELARSALAAARPEDRVWLFPTVGEPLAAGVSAGRAAPALGQIRPTDGAADLAAVVARAAAALPADGERRREVQLLSDLQASALRTAPAAAGDAAPLVAYAPRPPAEPNGALVDVELTGGTTAPSGTGHGVIVRSARSGPSAPVDPPDAAAAEADIRLELDGRLAGAARAPWGASAILGLPELGPGLHEGRLEVDPAGARADDLRYFAIRVVPPPTVRFHGDATSFVGLGIETLRDGGRLGTGGNAAVAVVDGDASVGAPWEGAETVIFVPPADPVDLAAFNQGLASAGIAWQARVDAGSGDLGLVEPEAAFSLSGVRVRQRYLLRATGGGSTADTALLRTEDGEPWLIRTESDDRLALISASSLTAGASDLPAHPAMVPFLEALLVHWSHLATWPFADFGAGRPLTLPEWASEVESPDGTVRGVEGGARFTPLRAGVYAVRGTGSDGAGVEAHFAANVPAEEADPTPMAPRELEELFAGRPVFTAGPDASAWEDGIFRARRGRDMAPWLIALALALIGIELYLATPGRSRRPSADGEGSEVTSGASN